MRKERKRSLFPLSRYALEISLTETASVCFLSESRKASESRTLLAHVRYSTDHYSSRSLSSCSQYFCNNLQWELSLPGFWLKSNNQDMTYPGQDWLIIALQKKRQDLARATSGIKRWCLWLLIQWFPHCITVEAWHGLRLFCIMAKSMTSGGGSWFNYSLAVWPRQFTYALRVLVSIPEIGVQW